MLGVAIRIQHECDCSHVESVFVEEKTAEWIDWASGAGLTGLQRLATFRELGKGYVADAHSWARRRRWTRRLAVCSF